MKLSSLFPFQTFLLWISLVYITAKFTCMQSYKCLFTWILSVLICGFHCLLVYITPVLFAFMDWVNIFVWRLVSWSFLMQHVQLLNGFPMFSSFMEKVMVSWSIWRLKVLSYENLMSLELLLDEIVTSISFSFTEKQTGKLDSAQTFFTNCVWNTPFKSHDSCLSNRSESYCTYCKLDLCWLE